MSRRCCYCSIAIVGERWLFVPMLVVAVPMSTPTASSRSTATLSICRVVRRRPQPSLTATYIHCCRYSSRRCPFLRLRLLCLMPLPPCVVAVGVLLVGAFCVQLEFVFHVGSRVLQLLILVV